MGQSQSDISGVDQTNQESSVKNDVQGGDQESSSVGGHDAQTPSFEDLIAEAMAFGDDENESLDVQAQKALECPCVAELRSGPCGTQFSEAFVCFLKSTAEEKGSDCVHPFVALQNSIKANPGAFSTDVLDGKDSDKVEKHVIEKEEVPTEPYRILPPQWAREPLPEWAQGPKPPQSKL